MASKILEQYRAQNPDASSQNDSQLARKIYEESYSDLDINTFGERVGVEPIKIAEDLHRQYYSDLEFNEFADRIGVEAPVDNLDRPELMTPLVNEPNNPEGRRFPDKGQPERVDAPNSSDTETQQDVGRIDSLSQAGVQTQNQTPLGNEGPGFRIDEPDLGPTGRDFSLTREQGITGAGTFEAADGSSLIGAPMGVDQNIDEAAQTAYQMQGRGERSADDLRRGFLRLQSANKAIQLVSSVNNILDANEGMERRDSQFIDNRNRLAGGNANVDPEFSEFVDRRGYPTRSESLVAQEREDRETIEREQQRAQELAGELAEIQARRDELGENVTLRRALESGDVDTFLGQLSENPLDVMSGLVLESLPAMTPALGAGVAGALTAGPGGAAVGAGTVSAITEGVLTIQEKLQEYGADLSDPESVQQVWSENGDEILADARTRGIVIGAFDAASGGIGAKPFFAARQASSNASRIARGTADATARTTTQGVLGSAGEASAQLATEGEISSPAEVIAEGVAEFGFAPVEVASLSAASARRRLSGPDDANNLRTQMLNEGYTEVGDGTLRRGDVIVEIDGDEARARLAQRDDPRQQTAPAPEPTEEAPAPAPVEPPQETPDQALDAVIDNASPPADLPDVQTSLEALNRRIQQREQELRSAGVPDDQIQSEQTIVSLRQQAQSLANVDRQTRSQQAEQNANNAIDSERAPTDDALGLQVQSIRQEARTRSPLRDEIQRLRERARAATPDAQTTPAQERGTEAAPEQITISARSESETQTTPALEEQASNVLQNRIQSITRDADRAEPAARDVLLAERDRIQSVLDGRAPRETPQERARRQLIVRPNKDTLVTAIQKLGGIDTSLETDWDGRLQSFRNRTPGLPGLERPGRGRSLDDLAESLVEVGYLQDRSVPELEERLGLVEQGRLVVSNMAEMADLEADLRSAPPRSRDTVEIESERIEGQAESIDEILSAAQEYFGSSDEAGSRFEESFYLRRGTRDDQRALGDAIAYAEELNEGLAGDIVVEGERNRDSYNAIRQRLENEIIVPRRDADRDIGARSQAQEAGQARGSEESSPQTEAVASDLADQTEGIGGANQLSVDQYIDRINPDQTRIAASERPTLNMGDMDSMLPSESRLIRQEGDISYFQSGDDFFATATNPNLNERQAVGYAIATDDGTDLAVVSEMQGQGIGTNLASLYRSNRPDAPSGGLTEAGERTVRRAFARAQSQESELLTQPTPEDLQARDQAEADRQAAEREADQRADADAQRDDFTLTGSDTEADQAAARGQDTLFSRGQLANGIDAQSALQHASQLMRSWKIAPRVEVVQSVSELPEIARRKIAQSDGSDPVRGVFHEGRVHVIADNVGSFAEVDEVILHEVIGHFGLRNVLGDSMNQTLDEVYSAISEADIQSIASRRKLDLSKDAERREAVEEYLADLAEADPQARIIDRIVRLIAEWARSMGMRLNMTNAEIKELMIRAKRFVQDGEIVRGRPIGGQMVGGVAMPAVGDEPSVRFSFAGTRSQNADLGSLEKAKSLQGSNTSAEVIRQQTGWFVGVDGQWRYEITDDGASLIESNQPSISEILEEIGDQIEVYQTVPGWYGATTRTDQFVLEGLGRTEQEAQEDAARRIAELRGGPSGIRTEQAGKSYRLDQILDHEKLYAAYPDLGGLTVAVRELDDARGSYNPGNDLIKMNATPDSDAFLSTLLHEVQHAIQHREGFATGGTSNVQFWQSVKSGIQELDTSVRNRVLGWQFENQDLLDQSAQASFNATMGLAYQSAQRLRDYASRGEPSGVFRLIRKEAQWIYEPTFDRLDEGRRIQGEFFNIPNRGPRRNEAISRLAYDAAELIESQIPDELLSEFRADNRKLDNMVRALRRNAERAREDLRELTNLQREAQRARNLRESNNLSSPYDTYRAIAGEIEARNTQARQSMTAEERARVSPEATQDVPSEEAIVIVGGAELRVPQTSLDNREDATAVRFSRRGVRAANASKESTSEANRNGFPVKFRNDAAKETTVYVAKDKDGNWIEMTTSDPALREQNALKAAMKRWFTKEGQLTDRAYELHTQMIGQRNADEIDISGFTADFLQSVSRTYGKSYQRLADSEKELLNNYLAGVDVQVPEAVKAELDVMRGMLDNLSTRTQMMLIDEVKYILQDMDPDQSAQTAELIRRAKNGDQDAITEIRDTSPNGNLIARKLRTFLAVEANKGGYLHRSYRAFDDPSWKDNVPEAVSRRAKSYLRDRLRRDPSMQNLSARAIDDRVDGIVNAILNSNSSDMVDFLSQSQLGEKDLSVLKQRDNIPEPIRDLMGEYKDPRVNFSRTMSQMSTLVASHQFLRSVREEGLGSFLSKEASGRMSQEITSFNEEKLLPLAGLYTTPEFRQALIDFANGKNLDGFMKHVVRVTSSVKYGKTVLSPTTMMRNFYSASMFTVMNGHFGYSNMLKAAQTTWADIRGNTKSRRDYMRRLAQLGVIHDSARAGEISAALDDVMDLDTTRGSAPARAAKETLNIATRMYQAGDDFWKIVGYETEVKDLTDTGMSREDAELLAAKRVRDGYPTYSMVPEAIQLLRRFPLVGTFVSFPWEIMRTSFNQIRMVQEDAKAGRNAKAMKRLAGMAIAYSSGYAIKNATMALFGIDDEEDEAVRKLAAPWQMNSQFAYLGNDGEGNMRYLDLSHLDPYNHLKRPISALMNGNYDNLGEGAIEGMKEFLAPYFGTDITAGVIGEIWANKKQSSGTSVYDENADRITQGIQAGTHLLDTLRPGIALNVERTFKAFNEQMTSYGREYTLQDEFMAWAGFRLTTSDPKISMQFKSFDFRDQRSAAGRPTYRVLRDPNVVSDREMRNGVESTYSRWQEGFEDMHAVVRAGRVAGMSDEEIVSSLEKGGVPKRDIAFIIRERVPPWSPSNQSIENAINSVLQYNDTPEMRENLKERFRAMRRAVIDERRNLNEEQAGQ